MTIRIDGSGQLKRARADLFDTIHRSTDLNIEAEDLIEARRINVRLAKAPRFRVRGPLQSFLIQTMLRLSQIGADRKLRRRGLTVEMRRVGPAGGEVPVRLLRSIEPPRGVVLDFHGGGWAIGNARMDDEWNAELVERCGVSVVSVEYRHAGRTPLQGIMDDCLHAARWALADARARRLPVVIAGESAGAHLAVATLLRLRDEPEQLADVVGAVLYYGVYDLAGSRSVQSAGPETLVLDGPGMLVAMRRLTPDMDDATRRLPPHSPAYADLAGLPPAMLVVGELDPLRDDTLDLGDLWEKIAGTEVHLVPEAPHGFIRFQPRVGRKVLDRTHAWIDARLRSG